MEYKNQTENRAFQEMLQAAVKRLQNRSGEDLAAKSGAVFHSSRNVLEVLSFYETIGIFIISFWCYFHFSCIRCSTSILCSIEVNWTLL